jgi:protein SCO1/2
MLNPMIKTTAICGLLLYICFVALSGAIPAHAQPAPPDDPLDKVGFDQKLNGQVPLDLVFRDEAGAPVRLGDYFGAKPVILTLNYYECPNLCTLVLTKLVETMRGLAFDAGNQFEVVTVSIDPRETPALATAKKATYLDRYGRAGAAGGWHFLTGEQPMIERLAAAVGFRYAYDARQDQYAHPTGIIVLTPQGTISRYFYDLEYSPKDLRLGLVEASEGKIGSPVDQFLLRCYHYDPISGKYTIAIMSIVRLATIATAIALGLCLLALLRRERGPRLAHEDGGRARIPMEQR